ncbi:MAG: peptidoglycan DD-metalloendopeptidase family protein [Gammaproteobacteria bacterium]|nr:peptidoglycan DD-metalloendopeptidase family protein [Gammaproteobacteria bacterium]
MQSQTKPKQCARGAIAYNWFFLMLLALLLPGCNNLAPIVEQGRVQEVNSPEITSSNGLLDPTQTVSSPDSSLDMRPEVLVSNADGSVSTVVVPNQNPQKYIVTAGDTLYSIAFRYELDYRQLALVNDIAPPYTIMIGQELSLTPAPSTPAPLTRRPLSQGNKPVDAPDPTLEVGPSMQQSEQPVQQREQPAQEQEQQENKQEQNQGSTSVDWQWPHTGTLLQEFKQGLNKGIDFSGKVGDPVLAAGHGDVVYSGMGVQGNSNLIIIRHTERFLSAYAHNSAILVPQGSQVKAGQEIARLGVNDEEVPMLHFEIRQNGLAVDPLQFLPIR